MTRACSVALRARDGRGRPRRRRASSRLGDDPLAAHCRRRRRPAAARRRGRARLDGRRGRRPQAAAPRLGRRRRDLARGRRRPAGRASRSRSRASTPISSLYATAERVHVSRDGGRFWRRSRSSSTGSPPSRLAERRRCGRTEALDEPEDDMSGLDDLIGSLTKRSRRSGAGRPGSLGIDDLLGGLLGGGVAAAVAAAAGCRTSSAGSSAAGGAARPGHASGGGMNMGALVGALGPLARQVAPGRRALEARCRAPRRTGLSAAGRLVGRHRRERAASRRARYAPSSARTRSRRSRRRRAISEDEAADVLAAVVPQVVNGLTPNGAGADRRRGRRLPAAGSAA